MSERKISLFDLKSMLENGGLHEYELREGYSGRGMNGKTCAGIVIDVDQLPRVYFAIGTAAGFAEADEHDSQPPIDWEGLLNGTAVDNMGRSMIVYWPRWTLES